MNKRRKFTPQFKSQVRAGVVERRTDEILDILAFAYHASTISSIWCSSESPDIEPHQQHTAKQDPEKGAEG